MSDVDPAHMAIERDLALVKSDVQREWEDNCRGCRSALQTSLSEIKSETMLTCQTVRRMEGELAKVLEFTTEQRELPDKVEDVQETVYGKGDQPGLKGHVNSLLETRSNVRWGFSMLWGLITALIVSIVKLFWDRGGAAP